MEFVAPIRSDRPNCLARNNTKWESMKDDIERIYIKENKTLPETMNDIRGLHDFEASVRKLKTKLREWKFDKYLTDVVLDFVAVKTKKRNSEGKATVFYHNGSMITAEKIQSFKRRKASREPTVTISDIGTPRTITYHTPPNSNDYSIISEGPVESTPTNGRCLEVNLALDASTQNGGQIHFNQTATGGQFRSSIRTDTTTPPESALNSEVLVNTTAFDNHAPEVMTSSILAVETATQPEESPLGYTAHLNFVESMQTSSKDSTDFGLRSATSDADPATEVDISNLEAPLDLPVGTLEQPGDLYTSTFEVVDSNYDMNPRFLSSVYTSHLPNMIVHAESSGSHTVFQNDYAIENVLEIGQNDPFGGPLFPFVNSMYHLVENLPWFQLQRFIDSSGFLHKNELLRIIFRCSSNRSRIPASISDSLGMEETRLAMDERFQLLTGFFNPGPSDKTEWPAVKLATHLLQYIPERTFGELEAKALQIVDPSNKFPVLSIFEVALYFSSNNLLSDYQTDTFLRWVVEKKYSELLKHFLRHKLPTLCAFTSRILESSVRIYEPELLKLLLDTSIDSRVLSGESGGTILRQLMCDSWLNERGIDPRRYTELAKILLRIGADPDVRVPRTHTHGTRALFYSVRAKQIEIVELLIEKGADVNARSDTYSGPDSALACAVIDRDIELLRIFLESGTSVDLSHINRLPVLEWAALNSTRVYDMLLEKSEISRTNFHLPGILQASKIGNSALSNYMRQGSSFSGGYVRHLLDAALSKAVNWAPSDFHMLEALLNVGANPNTPATSSLYPIEMALSDGNIKAVKTLLEAGADVTAKYVLRSAATKFECLDLLLDYGVDLEMFGDDALHHACHAGNLECSALLVKSGVPVNARHLGATPLQTAARKGHMRVVKFLVEQGADVNAPAGFQKKHTALQWAAHNGNLTMVDFFLGLYADVNAAPSKTDGYTALEAVATMPPYNGSPSKKIHIFKLLLSKGALINRPHGDSRCRSTTTTLHALIDCDIEELTRLAVSSGADVNFLTSGIEGRTPLQLAAEKGQLETVRLLLENGAEVNFRPAHNFGRTALQAAACCASPALDVLQLLLDRGAEVNAEPAIRGGVTALQGAAIQGHINIALALLAAGANINAAAAITEGRTVVEGAAEHGRLDMVQLLLDAGALGDPDTGFEKAIKAAEQYNHFAVADLLRERVQQGTA